MTANDLIKLAKKKGYQIEWGGYLQYYYSWKSKMGRTHEREFNGTFQEFVKFIKEL